MIGPKDIVYPVGKSYVFLHAQKSDMIEADLNIIMLISRHLQGRFNYD